MKNKNRKFLIGYVDLLDKNLPLELLRKDYSRLLDIPRIYKQYRDIVRDYGNPNVFFAKDEKVNNDLFYKTNPDINGISYMYFDGDTGQYIGSEGFDAKDWNQTYAYQLPVKSYPLYHEVVHAYYPNKNLYGWNKGRYENLVNQISAAMTEIKDKGVPLLPIIEKRSGMERLKDQNAFIDKKYEDKINKNYEYYKMYVLPSVVKWYLYGEKPNFVELMQNIEE